MLSRTRNSSIIRFSRTSDLTRANSATSLTGLVRKSSAPTSRPCRRLATSDRAVTITTGTSAVRGLAFSWRQTSKPSIRGIMTSRRMTSGSSVSAILRAAGPLNAGKTSKYSLDSLASSNFTLASTSSTTNTRPDISVPQLVGLHWALSREKALDGSQETRYRYWFSNICFATALSDLLFVSFHRKSSYRDDRDCAQIFVLLDPLGDLETRYFGKLDIHQDKVGTMLTRKFESFDPVFALQRTIAMGYQKIIEELHIEIVVLNDQHLLPERSIGARFRCGILEPHAHRPRKAAGCRPANRRSRTVRLVCHKTSGLTIRNRTLPRGRSPCQQGSASASILAAAKLRGPQSMPPESRAFAGGSPHQYMIIAAPLRQSLV